MKIAFIFVLTDLFHAIYVTVLKVVELRIDFK